MQLEFLSLLPEEIRAKVAAVEQATGSEIVVHCGSTADYIGANPEPPAGVCICDDRKGLLEIEIRLVPGFKPHHLLHEVLHAYRASVGRAPRLHLAGGATNSLTDALTNDSEHLFIVPEEIRLDQEAQEFWHAERDRYFEALKAQPVSGESDFGGARAARHGFLRLWVSAKLTTPSWPRLGDLQTLLQLQGWEQDAQMLLKEVELVMPSADRVLAAFLRAGGLNPAYFSLYTWRVSPGQVDVRVAPVLRLQAAPGLPFHR